MTPRIDLLRQLPYTRVWVIDSEFIPKDGQIPICVVAKELYSGQIIRWWAGDPPPVFLSMGGSDNVYVAFAADAEWGTYLALEWPLPERVICLHTEYCQATNRDDRPKSKKLTLLNALADYDLPPMSEVYKDAMRTRILQGFPFNEKEKHEILEYCLEDVLVTEQLLYRMLPAIAGKRLPYVLLAGRYTHATARIVRCGIPINVPRFNLLRDHWQDITGELIRRIDEQYGVYENRVFKEHKFERLITEAGIAWPRTKTGKLSTKKETLKEMARAYPEFHSLYELKSTLEGFEHLGFPIGSDGRNRTGLIPFRTKTSRNAPRASEFIFAGPSWLRHFVQAPPGYALISADWRAQEYGIAAARSRDPHMLENYLSGDCYMAAAIDFHRAPAGATKASHPEVRDLFKIAILAVQYEIAARRLSIITGLPLSEAYEFIQTHRHQYSVYWKWSDRMVDNARLKHRLKSALGWELAIVGSTKKRTLRNWMIQTTGAELLRLTACEATERRIAVAALIHDALLAVCRIEEAEETAARLGAIMRKTSRTVLKVLELDAEPKIIPYTQYYTDKRGANMWAWVNKILDRYELLTESAVLV